MNEKVQSGLDFLLFYFFCTKQTSWCNAPIKTMSEKSIAGWGCQS